MSKVRFGAVAAAVLAIGVGAAGCGGSSEKDTKAEGSLAGT